MLLHFHLFSSSGTFLIHDDLPAYPSLSCRKTPIAIGQILWHTTSTFLVTCFSYLWFVCWLVVFFARFITIYQVVFFDICFLYKGCTFLTGVRLASYSLEVLEWVVKRSIFDPFLQIFRGFCTLLIFYASASTGLQGGLVSWYPFSPLLLRRR